MNGDLESDVFSELTFSFICHRSITLWNGLVVNILDSCCKHLVNGKCLFSFQAFFLLLTFFELPGMALFREWTEKGCQ